jgi:hypothetical protein
MLTRTNHCCLLPDQSRHVLSACLYRCIARCLCGVSSDILLTSRYCGQIRARLPACCRLWGRLAAPE